MTTPTPPLSERDAAVRQRLAVAVEPARLDAAWEAYQSASISGLCHEGAWEVALGARPESEPAAPLPSPADPRS